MDSRLKVGTAKHLIIRENAFVAALTGNVVVLASITRIAVGFMIDVAIRGRFH